MTFRQQLAAKKIMENHGVVSKTMLEVGYDPNTAKNPSNLTNSKGWKELMEQYLPDESLMEKHNEFLNAKKVTRYFKKGELETEEEETDPVAIRALDLAYKVKSKYPKGTEVNIHGEKVIAILGGLTANVSSDDSNEENPQS